MFSDGMRVASQRRAANMLAKSERCDSLPSGVASPSGPLGAPHSSASGAEDGRGCDDESGDPTYAPVPRKASLSSGDSESAPEHAHCLSASGSGFSDAAHLGARAPPVKRKVGRPIADHRHPDSPSLTPQERRRIKRRIANRESARRVRARRQGTLEEMLLRIGELEGHNSELLRHTVECESHCHQLREQALQFDARWRAMSVENERMEREAGSLRLRLQGLMGHDLPAGVLADGGSAPASQPAPHAAGQAAMRRPRSRPAVARPAGGAPQEAASGEMPRAASGSLGQVMGCGRAVLAAGRMNTAEMLDVLLPSADSLTLPPLDAFTSPVF